MKKITGFLAVLLLATILTQNVWAEAQFGSVDFDLVWGDGSLKGEVIFGVFDSASQTDYSNFTSNLEIEDPFDSIAADEYIYVYQITNDDPLSDIAISSFSVFAKDADDIIDENALINSFSDSPDELSEEGIEPTSYSYDAGSSSIIWDFGDVYIQKDEYSWFLMLKSTLAPIAGDFEIKGPSDSIQVPGSVQTNPEPATMALFGLGSLILLRKRKIRIT